MLKATVFPVPVVVIGNITVGGVGKTPLVIFLANLLKLKGYAPGIVSRGYGSQCKTYPAQVDPLGDARRLGDEPFMLAAKTQCPVVIDPKRARAVEFLLKNNHCDVVLSDDGLQHYALRRDLEIAVLDGERRLGNGLMLPAGPLREGESRLNEVDFIITNGITRQKEYVMHLQPDGFFLVQDFVTKVDLTLLQGKKIHALAGIGNPQRFFDTLSDLGLDFVAHRYPDHHQFTYQDIDFLDADYILMTEKDAVKCGGFADRRHCFLRVDVELDKPFIERFLSKIKTSVNK